MTGKLDAPGQPNVDQMKMMIARLLADRFQLKFHFEKRELLAYTIRIAKTGAKITKSQDDPKGIPGWNFGRTPSGQVFSFRNSPMLQFAAPAELDGQTCGGPVRPFGKVRLHIAIHTRCDPSGAAWWPPARAVDNHDAAPDSFSASQQQLGLKLEPTKAPVDVMVIDKVERPSEN
jgi:uncharacterized protein (TIGR03435 family)